MSILIKGMKMPKDCPMCPLSHWNKLDNLTGCELVQRYVPESDMGYWHSDHRPEWCPLVEIPPHGALINREALLDEIAVCLERLEDAIDEQIAIIEAEEPGPDA